MFNKENLTEDQKMARELRLQGKSRREVAMELWQVSSRESTLRSWESKGLLDEDEGLVEEPVVVEEDTLDENTLDSLCESTDWSVSNLAKRLRSAQRSNNQLRKVQREMFDSSESGDNPPKNLLDVLEEASVNINKAPEVIMNPSVDGQRMTAEILLSDTQYGKLMHGYNTDVAVARTKEYLKTVIDDIVQKVSQGIVFDKIILALLGDIIESDKKHANSGRACDSGTAEQMKIATEVLFNDVIEPLAVLGYPVDVVMITGNHDHDGRGLEMYLPGSQHLSWPLYHSLRMITEAKGYTHVDFEIPDGAYFIKDIYGFNTLYEHGVGVSTSEAALTKRLVERGNQVRKHMTYIRIGDKHNVSRFNTDTKVINGSTFGRCDDKNGGEYSAIAGYAAEPAQLTIYHTPRQEGDSRLSVCDSLLVQLGHVKKD